MDGTISETFMSLRYENCNENCFNEYQNITFCTKLKSMTTSKSFANEQTIEMIKILIGKLQALFIDVRLKYLETISVDDKLKILITVLNAVSFDVTNITDSLIHYSTHSYLLRKKDLAT